uniref:Uncharacterized protein n=1 Tax=Arundo donax TaxID=35708 RepID=A0A0A9F3Z0_ARUDO
MALAKRINQFRDRNKNIVACTLNKNSSKGHQLLLASSHQCHIAVV